MIKTATFGYRRGLFAGLVLLGLVLAQSASAQLYPMDSRQGMPGEELFPVCSFCHGAQGQGGPALDAPALAGMEAWYVERQLHNFRNRIRGMHYEDVPGVQMSIVSGMVRNDATIRNIAEYIEDMEPGAPPELVRGEPAGTARPFIWRSKYADLILTKLITVADDGSFQLDMSYFDYATGLTMTNKKFDVLFGGPPRKSETELTQREMDLAASVQKVTEDIIIKLAKCIAKETREKNLCLAGGVALNCVAIQSLLSVQQFVHLSSMVCKEAHSNRTGAA